MGLFEKVLTRTLLVFWTLSAMRARAEGDKPQSLETKDYTVCGKKLKLEVAHTEEQRMIGLMHRTGVPHGTGMLFSFPQERLMQFWMRNVPFSIDIAYFDARGKLAKAMTMAGTSTLTLDEALPRYSSEKPVLYAVEAEEGFFTAKAAIQKGCKISPLPPRGQ